MDCSQHNLLGCAVWTVKNGLCGDARWSTQASGMCGMDRRQHMLVGMCVMASRDWNGWGWTVSNQQKLLGHAGWIVRNGMCGLDCFQYKLLGYSGCSVEMECAGGTVDNASLSNERDRTEVN